MFELGEDLFDRVEIGAIGRQEEQPCACGPDRGTNGSALVAAEIIQDDDVAWPKRWDENFFDVETEGLAVDRTVENPRSLDAIMAESGEEGQGLPMAVRNLGMKPLTPSAPAAQRRRHIRLGPGFVDEDETARINLCLTRLPSAAATGDVQAVLLAGCDGFFLKIKC